MTKQIALTVDDALYNAIKDHVAVEGISMAELLRKAVIKEMGLDMSPEKILELRLSERSLQAQLKEALKRLEEMEQKTKESAITHSKVVQEKSIKPSSTSSTKKS